MTILTLSPQQNATLRPVREYITHIEDAGEGRIMVTYRNGVKWHFEPNGASNRAEIICCCERK